MTKLPKETNELLVVSLTPQNLERGVLWFAENFFALKKSRLTNLWWQNNSLILEKDRVIKPAELAKKFLELGYERSSQVLGQGLFASRGGLLEIWPVNTAKPYLIEFSGNCVSLIREREEAQEYFKPRPILKDSVEKLADGAFVVHEDHGIGIFRGITSKEFSISPPIRQANNFQFSKENKIQDTEFFTIEYAAPRPGAEPDKLFVPLNQKGRLTPYVGFENPRINRLGGNFWEKSKRKAKEDIEKLSRQLLELYAKRNLAQRPPNLGDKDLEENLRQSFTYKETPDQLRAEQEILADLESPYPMDRILCGDVGFGKTEVALRAAVRVISSGRQVALLSPTTVLAVQHEKTTTKRIGASPLKIKMLSRLTPSRDKKHLLSELKAGKIDLLIGTHRILSKDIEFKNLGLVIIDEEQRFGVKQKEKLKELRVEADILSLSATPIPRTLQFTLAGLRQISQIETPPPERIPIRTFVLPYSAQIIKESILSEIKRGGQIYFLHNRIETMGQVRKKLEKVVKDPHLIGIMHGRLPEKEMLKVMEKFRGGEIKILLATTIIENGLDISEANTLIVDDATRLGLAEAHQLRGRVGRGSEQAFAYFLYKPKHLTEKSGDRLQALKEYSGLGSGYDIAMRDLETRGAGNILGREQSGSVNRLGLNLYYQMLHEAVDEEKQKLPKTHP